MKDTTFSIYEPATEENMNELLEHLSIFDDNISELRSKAKLSKYPEFLKFLSRHTDVKTYSFHIFKCADPPAYTMNL